MELNESTLVEHSSLNSELFSINPLNACQENGYSGNPENYSEHLSTVSIILFE